MSEILPIETSWWQLVTERAALTPDLTFLSDEQGRVVTFRRYRELAEEVAAGLAELGVRAGQVVSWQLPTTLEAAVLAAALCRLGVRQNPIIPILRRTEVGMITEQVGSDWLVVRGRYRGFDFVEMAGRAIGDRPCQVLVVDDYAKDPELALPRADPAQLEPATDPGDAIRWYYYSSGTTAAPKGAKHTDASVMASTNALVAYVELGSDDLMPVAFPLTHIGGAMLLALFGRIGGQLLLIEAFDPVATPPLMAARGATLLGSATPFFRAYLDAQRRHGDQPLFGALRGLLAGGAPISPELNEECLEVLGMPIINQWGLTEFPAATSLSRHDPPDKFNGTAGRVGPGVDVKAVDPDGRPAAPEVEGELLLRGPQQCKGYVDASLDASAFDSEGYFRTGDLGTVDGDGFVRITGRLKDVIIRNAENLSAQEIEDTLVEHPAIADVAVIGIPDPRTGERALAIVVLAPGHDSITLAELAQHCRDQGLARQKVPEQLHIIDVLPRNPMGKVLKHVLRAEAAG